MKDFIAVDGTRISEDAQPNFYERDSKYSPKKLIKDIDKVNIREEGVEFKYQVDDRLKNKKIRNCIIEERHYVINEVSGDTVLEGYTISYSGSARRHFVLRSFLENDFTLIVEKEEVKEEIISSPLEFTTYLTKVSVYYRGEEIIQESQEFKGLMESQVKKEARLFVYDNLDIKITAINSVVIDPSLNEDKIILKEYDVQSIHTYRGKKIIRSRKVKAISGQAAEKYVEEDKLIDYKVTSSIKEI